MRQTTIINEKTRDKKWYVVDATNHIVGRLATSVALILRGKNKPTFTPHVDCGDNVIIINCNFAKFSANKMRTKKYYQHSLYPGGMKVKTAEELAQKHPEKILEKAIYGMLPKNKLGAQQYRNLFVYKDGKHHHAAQQPVELKIITEKNYNKEKI